MSKFAIKEVYVCKSGCEHSSMTQVELCNDLQNKLEVYNQSKSLPKLSEPFLPVVGREFDYIIEGDRIIFLNEEHQSRITAEWKLY